jgi:hypothetical protein
LFEAQLAATSTTTCCLAAAAAAAAASPLLFPAGNPATAKPSSILTGAGLPSRRVTAVPKQFHFHTSSEHVVSGRSLPLEMHVVHYVMPSQLPSCPPDGCIVVLGVLFELTDDAGECGAHCAAATAAVCVTDHNTAALTR